MDRPFLALVVLLAALGHGSGSSAQLTFEERPVLPLGGPVAGVHVGTIDGDDVPDLIVHLAGGSLRPLLGDGQGGFTAGAPIVLGGLVFGLALGDLNGDGIQDVAAANRGAGTVDLWVGDGTGVFSPVGSVASPEASTLAVRDVSGDLIPDLVVGGATPTAGAIRFLIGDGFGGFAPGPAFPIGINPYRMLFGDHDGDGTEDIVVTCTGIVPGPPGGIYTLLDDGAGGRTVVATSDGYYSDFAQGDFDEDGTLDLILNHNNDIVCFFFYQLRLGDGAGGFLPGTGYFDTCGPYRFAVADLDLDGHLDYALGNPGVTGVPHRLSIFRGSGQATFAAPVDLLLPDAPGELASSDLDRDGRDDLVVASGSQLAVFLNRTPPVEPRFRRGDVGRDGLVNIADPVELLGHLFIPGSPEIPCPDAADANDDGALLLDDPVLILQHLFVPSSPPPASPHPDCGPDPTVDALSPCPPLPACT